MGPLLETRPIQRTGLIISLTCSLLVYGVPVVLCHNSKAFSTIITFLLIELVPNLLMEILVHSNYNNNMT